MLFVAALTGVSSQVVTTLCSYGFFCRVSRSLLKAPCPVSCLGEGKQFLAFTCLHGFLRGGCDKHLVVLIDFNSAHSELRERPLLGCDPMKEADLVFP